jgi:hypothetical protein
MKRLAVAAVLFALLAGCTVGGNDAASLCACDAATEKFDETTKTCVAPDKFTAPATCEDDGAPVCGCDQQNYTSSCAAWTIGVEVQYGGACHAAGTGSNGGGGLGGFGW